MDENVLPVLLPTVDSATDRLRSCPCESGNGDELLGAFEPLDAVPLLQRSVVQKQTYLFL